MLRIIPTPVSPFTLINPVPLKYFYRWRDTYISRNIRFDKIVGSNPVNLSNEDLFTTFSIAGIKTLVDAAQNGQFLTIHFTCLDTNSQFSKLNATICIMDYQDPLPKSNFIWPNGVNPPDFTKPNYGDRKFRIGSFVHPIRHEFTKDESGVAYAIDRDLRKYFSDLSTSGQTDIKLIFAKVPDDEDDYINGIQVRKGILSVIFAPANFDPMETLDSRLFALDLQDFGGACCPPS